MAGVAELLAGHSVGLRHGVSSSRACVAALVAALVSALALGRQPAHLLYDRRGITLAVTAAIQLIVLFESVRRPRGHPDPIYLVLAAIVVLACAIARLPLRSRIALAYCGASILVVAMFATGKLAGQGRYLAPGGVAVAIATMSLLAPRAATGLCSRLRG